MAQYYTMVVQWLMRHCKHHSQVALKFLHPEWEQK